MAGSSFGCIFRVTTWGESHGPALGAVVDGCPAGLPLSPADFRPLMERRRPNAGPMSTMRKEADEVEILSGVFEGKTTGTPVSLLIRNTDQHSADYGPIAHIFRPGHADFGFAAKYGIRDYRGGGRSSGRETAGRVAAAAIAEKILARVGVTFKTKVVSVGGRPTAEAEEGVAAARAAGDALGSVVECVIRGVPAGIGEQRSVPEPGRTDGDGCQPRRRHSGRHQRRSRHPDPRQLQADTFDFPYAADRDGRWRRNAGPDPRTARPGHRTTRRGGGGGDGGADADR